MAQARYAGTPLPRKLGIREGRPVILPLGLVDRKVCAIDPTWSGLLFSWRRD